MLVLLVVVQRQLPSLMAVAPGRSEAVRGWAERKGIALYQLQRHFNRRLFSLLRELGKQPLGWDEILDGMGSAAEEGHATNAIWIGSFCQSSADLGPSLGVDFARGSLTVAAAVCSDGGRVVVQSWRGPEGVAEGTRRGYRMLRSHGYYLDHLEPGAKHHAIEAAEWYSGRAR